jgi:hypothetical protein
MTPVSSPCARSCSGSRSEALEVGKAFRDRFARHGAHFCRERPLGRPARRKQSGGRRLFGARPRTSTETRDQTGSERRSRPRSRPTRNRAEAVGRPAPVRGTAPNKHGDAYRQQGQGGVAGPEAARPSTRPTINTAPGEPARGGPALPRTGYHSLTCSTGAVGRNLRSQRRPVNRGDIRSSVSVSYLRLTSTAVDSEVIPTLHSFPQGLSTGGCREVSTRSFRGLERRVGQGAGRSSR